MRNSKRIPICLKLFRKKEVFLKFYNDESRYRNFIKNYKYIKDIWKKYPDLRFGQLLINEGFIEDGYQWNIEESNWLQENNFIRPEYIEFWGINYDKNEIRLKETKFKLLRNLELEHIKNIIKFFERHNAIKQLNKKYLEYFNKRIDKNE